MKLQAIKHAIVAGPAGGQVLVLHSGERVEVPHPDFALFPGPEAEQDFFFGVKRAGGFTLVSAEAVSSLDVSGPARKR